MTPRTRASLGFAPKENPASSTVLWNEINCPPNMLQASPAMVGEPVDDAKRTTRL